MVENLEEKVFEEGLSIDKNFI